MKGKNYSRKEVHMNKTLGLMYFHKNMTLSLNEFLLQKSSLINTLWRAFQHTSSSMKSAYNTAQVSQPSMMDRISGGFLYATIFAKIGNC